MKIKRSTINALKSLIAAREGEVPYFKGNEIVDLFKDIGIDKALGNMSRGNYVIERLEEINGTQQLKNLIEEFIFSAFHQLEQGEKVVFLERLDRILNIEGYEIKDNNGKYFVTGGNIIGNGTTEVYFSNIQPKIIEAIRKAEYTIWIAVAWFTDKKILKELIKKTTEGVNVRLIIIDDNQNARIPFEKHFETVRILPWGKHKNIMHNKFCIIDNKTVISGAYNWSNKAKYNKESIEIKDDDPVLAKKYAQEFKSLINGSLVTP